MNQTASAHHPRAWTVAICFLLVYLSWGTTYFVIRVGVHDHRLPPALFGGVRVLAAGIILLAFLRFRVERLWLSRHDLVTATLVGTLFFVGGNGLLTAALDDVPSGVAAVLAGTTLIWISVIEAVWPRGDRLRWIGWLGLLAGGIGVVLLYAPEISKAGGFSPNVALLFVMTSNATWALGSVLLRHRRCQSSAITIAAYQMVIGGGGLALIGLSIGEVRELTPAHFTPGAWGTFFYLLIFGSLVGFVAFNYLLKHVAAPLVGTYAYVNPMIAIVVGWGLGGEELTFWTIGGMAVILTGVALVRAGARPGHTVYSKTSRVPLAEEQTSSTRF